VLSLFFVSIFLLKNATEPFPVFAASVESHMDQLRGAYPMEIVSSDEKEVLKWFEGKLDFAIKVPKFPNGETKLVGARLCHLKDKRAAFLTYDRNGQKISVFFIDLHKLKIPQAEMHQGEDHAHFVKSNKGYQSVLCLSNKLNGVGCIFVSDIPKEELLNIIL